MRLFRAINVASNEKAMFDIKLCILICANVAESKIT